MSRPLTQSERNIRMNIRNAFMVATIAELESEIEIRTNREDFLAVRFLKELKTEIERENKVSPQNYEAFSALKNSAEVVGCD